ncbi:MAG: TraR/DksA C4-type zinc finger protein [Candidatus Latescibacterota bacterium]|nr:MAG: TraR/DksA C4-type zinc finger protein [Candidatus Latescibacterota bacterium]
MNKRELARFRKLVEEERERVLKKLGVIGEEISDRTSNKASGSQGYSNHMADIGSDAMEQEQAFLHASQGTDYLRRLDDALKRIEDGTYGVCEECSSKIPVKRLEAYLAAKLCVDCKSKQEKLQRS